MFFFKPSTICFGTTPWLIGSCLHFFSGLQELSREDWISWSLRTHVKYSSYLQTPSLWSWRFPTISTLSQQPKRKITTKNIRMFVFHHTKRIKNLVKFSYLCNVDAKTRRTFSSFESIEENYLPFSFIYMASHVVISNLRIMPEFIEKNMVMCSEKASTL